MPFVPAICTQCGAQLEVDNTKAAAICQYCGTPFIVEKAINNYSVTNHINAQVVNICNGSNSNFEIVAGVLKKYNGSSVDIVIPEGVVAIADEAFKDNGFLNSVRFPLSLKEIGYRAFASCYSLKSIHIPDNVTYIGCEAFMFCSELKNVILPKELKYVTQGIFYYCTALENINIPSPVKSIDANAFYNCKSLNNVQLSTSLEEINEGAFAGCHSLKSIIIPENVTFIGAAGVKEHPRNFILPFGGCNSLAEIEYPSNLSADCFIGSAWYDNYKEDLSKRICPACKTKLSFFGNKCKKCGKKYEIE